MSYSSRRRTQYLSFSSYSSSSPNSSSKSSTPISSPSYRLLPYQKMSTVTLIFDVYKLILLFSIFSLLLYSYISIHGFFQKDSNKFHLKINPPLYICDKISSTSFSSLKNSFLSSSLIDYSSYISNINDTKNKFLKNEIISSQSNKDVCTSELTNIYNEAKEICHPYLLSLKSCVDSTKKYTVNCKQYGNNLDSCIKSITLATETKWKSLT